MIYTYSGKHVNPFDLAPSDIDIRDIAHALALINRFVGHTPAPISVAQHSVYVSRLCDERYALQGLLHDASEAFLGDVSKWVKASPVMMLYREAEDRALERILNHFGCVGYLHKSVLDADKLMVRFEAWKAFGVEMALFHRPDGAYPLPSKEEIARIGAWKPWSWTVAEDAFLQRFSELTGLSEAGRPLVSGRPARSRADRSAAARRGRNSADSGAKP